MGPLPQDIQPPPANEEDALTDGYYAVDRILAHKYDRNTLKFLVKWKNCADELNEWVPQSRVTQEAKEEYKKTPEYLACKADIERQQAERAEKAQQREQRAQQNRQPQPGARRSERLARVNQLTGQSQEQVSGRIHVLRIQTFIQRARFQMTRDQGDTAMPVQE
jgi:Chromo (CHRromatin Organisation MOdifier) domain